MFIILHPQQDATIYEKYPERNTGIDQILELTKYTLGEYAPDADSVYTQWESTFNSRMLLKFPISQITTMHKCYLTLTATDSESLPINYTVYAYPLTEDWVNGNGNYNDFPEIKNGVSWAYKSGITNESTWSVNSSSSFWTSVTGGGSWNSNYVASQSFDYESPDIRMDVTDIVNAWSSSAIPNYGFIIKYSNADESGSNSFGSIKYFSRDTHTIHVPKLEVHTSSSVYSGSFTSSSLVNSNFVLYISNLRDYNAGERARIRIHARDKYPTQTYATSSVYLTERQLPSTTYYKIIDHESDVDVIYYNTVGTKISTDDDGHYIDLDFDNFFPERYYRIQFKIENSNEDIIIDNGFLFKINR